MEQRLAAPSTECLFLAKQRLLRVVCWYGEFLPASLLDARQGWLQYKTLNLQTKYEPESLPSCHGDPLIWAMFEELALQNPFLSPLYSPCNLATTSAFEAASLCC